MPNRRWTEAEIARRLPLWHALAELFLDTEMQPHHYAAVRDAALGGGFTTDQTLTILVDEVFPAFVFNILDIAGEWAGFDEAFVRETMLRPIRFPSTWAGRVAGLQGGFLRAECARVRDVMEGGDPARIAREAAAPRPVRRAPVMTLVVLLLVGALVIGVWAALP